MNFQSGKTREEYFEIYKAVKQKVNVFPGGWLDKVANELGLKPKNLRTSFAKRYKNYIKNKAIEDECLNVGIDIDNVNHYWYKGEHFSIHVKNKPVSYDDIREDLIKELKEYSPKFPYFKRKPIKDGHLLVIDPADIHVGKLASSFESDEYNSKIAVERVVGGVKGILNKASGFNIDKILFIMGNDVLHVDTPKRTTTAGTPQDTDVMWYEAFLIAKELIIECISLLLPIAPVHVEYNPSNHDYTNGFFLADVIQTWFRNSDDITFNCDLAHRKYFTYHSNLIGTTHGDGAKNQDLPLLMAHEAKDWTNEEKQHRYIYTHHVHHKSSKDHLGVCVESLRSPSGTDSWHHRNGYQHAPKAVEGFIHHPHHGQIARLTHIF